MNEDIKKSAHEKFDKNFKDGLDDLFKDGVHCREWKEGKGIETLNEVINKVNKDLFGNMTDEERKEMLISIQKGCENARNALKIVNPITEGPLPKYDK